MGSGPQNVTRTMTIDLETLLNTLAERVAERLRTTPPLHDRQRLMSVAQAAKYLARSKQSVHRLTASGALPVVRADRRVFLDREDLDQFISRNKH
jgi:excisionase family DNA binding protein